MKVYIASLSDYNNGRLEGKWFDLSDYLSASDLMDDINDMLNDLTEKYNDGEVREEWAVHDYEDIPPTLASEYMGEADFEKLLEIRKVAEDRNIPVEVLVERAGDTGSDDYEALADSLVMVVDGYDETDIVYELEDQLGELGNDFWKDYIFIDDVTERVMYGEDVDRYREDILYENPDMDEEEAERQAEEMADEEADRRRDLSTYLEDMGYGDEIPNFVTKDYNDAWKYALSYDYDVIHHDGEMYVFTNNYSLGGTILSGLVGAYIGYKIGRAKPQKKGFSTEKKIGRKIKGAFSKKKFANGGGVYSSDSMYELNVFDGKSNELLTTKRFRARNQREAKELGQDYEYEMQQKYGDYLRFEVSEAKPLMARGGGIGFKGLSAKVAKRYEGKKPQAKYRAEYGKRYSKSEAKEVGDKVAGKVYWQQKGRKMANGGAVEYVDVNDYTKNYFFRRYEGAIGSFAWMFNGRYIEGILFPLDSFDKKYYADLKLKSGEQLLRFSTERFSNADKYQIKPFSENKFLVKLNLDKGLIYFMSDDNDEHDDRNVKFDSRGTKAEYIVIDKSKFAEGGGVSRFKEGDRVTNKKGKNRGVGFIVKIDSSGMAFVDFEEEGKTEFMSLEDLKKTNQSRYEQGGGVSGIDDLIRG